MKKNKGSLVGGKVMSIVAFIAASEIFAQTGTWSGTSVSGPIEKVKSLIVIVGTTMAGLAVAFFLVKAIMAEDKQRPIIQCIIAIIIGIALSQLDAFLKFFGL